MEQFPSEYSVTGAPVFSATSEWLFLLSLLQFVVKFLCVLVPKCTRAKLGSLNEDLESCVLRFFGCRSQVL
jgi:hypothetical protein